MTEPTLTKHDAAGMKWWNSLSTSQRAAALNHAMVVLGTSNASVADAWRVHCEATNREASDAD